MAKLNDLVLDKMDEIVTYLQSTPDYQRFCEVSAKMQRDDDVMKRVKKVKALQREIVKMEIAKEDISSKEREIDEILDELKSYPLYLEYTYLLEDLNNTFQEIKDIIEKYLNDVTN